MKKIQSIKRLAVSFLVVISFAMMILTVISVTTLNRTDRKLFGFRMYIVVSDSMKKTDFSAGDLIFVKDIDTNKLQAGDVISYISQNEENYGEVITHKIRKKVTNYNGKAGFITYGTSNNVDDKEIVTTEYILGKYSFKISKAGSFFNFLKSDKGYFYCILLPFSVLIIYQTVNVFKLYRRYKKEKAEEAIYSNENELLLKEIQELKKKLSEAEEIKQNENL